MNEDAKIRTQKDGFWLLGICAAQFSALEFHTQFLLSLLATGKQLSVETVILTRRRTFADKIDFIRHLAQLREPEYPELAKRIMTLADTLDTLRARRNSFIHGYWLINEYVIAEGVVRCSDTNWKYDKKTQSWNSMSTEDIPLDEFYAIPNHVAGVIEEVHTVTAQLAALQPKRENPIA
jgi:hypothetical protein